MSCGNGSMVLVKAVVVPPKVAVRLVAVLRVYLVEGRVEDQVQARVLAAPRFLVVGAGEGLGVLQAVEKKECSVLAIGEA